MPKLVFRVNADTSPVKKFRNEIEQIEKTMIRIKGENFSFDHWIKEFDRLKTKLEKKRVRIAELKKEILSVDSFTNPKAVPPLEKEYAKAKKDQEALINETMDLSNKFGKAYDDLVETLGKAQKVTDSVTVKLIEQKNVVANLQSEVRLLNAEYRNADKEKKADILSQKTSKQKELEQERVTLNALRSEQERAKLAVKGLADETRNYEKVVGKVSGAQAEAALVSSRFEKSLLRIGGIATLQRFASDVIKVRGEFQQLDVAFTTLLQSKEKANSLMGQMVETAAKTPFNLTEIATGAKQLVAYGFASEQINDTLVRLGNIAAGLGLPLERLTFLYGTTMTQGRLYARDLMQFTTSGIPMLQGLADIYGVSTDKVNEMVTAGKIGFPEVQKVIENMTNEGGKFYNLMEEQSKTITGKISNLGDAWDEMLNKIGKSQEGIINGSIDVAKFLVEHYEEIGRILIGIIGTYGVYKTALITNIALTHSWAVATRADAVAKGIQTIATKAQTIAQIALNSAMKANPAVLVASLVAGVAAAMWVLHDSTSAVEKTQRKYNNEQEKFINKENERKQKIEELIRVIQDETETQYSKIKAYEELQRYSPALVSAYNMEQLATLELAKSQKVLNEERDNVNYDNIIASIKKYTEYVNRLSKPGDKMKNVGDMYSGMVSEYGVNTTFKDRLELAIEDLKKWKEALDEYKRLKKEAEENAKPVEVKLLEAKNSRDQIVQEYASAKLTLEEEQRKIKESGFGVIPIDVQIRFDTAKAQLSNIDKIIAALMQGNTTQTYKEAYSTAEREWKKAQKALVESKKKSKAEYIAAKKDLDEKEKNFKDLGGVTNTNKQESAAEKRKKEQKKRNEELITLRKNNQKSEVDLMEEGSKKKIAQIELDYQNEIDAIKKQEEEWSKAQAGKLTQEQSINISVAYNNVEGKRDKGKSDVVKEEAEKLKGLLDKYQDYVTKRLNAEKQFNVEREKLEKSGASDVQLNELEYQRKETFDSIDNEFAMREDSFKAWADNIANLSLEKLRELLVQAERELERSEFLNPNDPKLAGQRARVTSLKNAVSEKSAETNISPNKRSQKEWQDLYKTLSNVENEFDEIGKAVGGTAEEIISTAGGVTASTLKMIDGIVSLSDSSAWAISSTATAAEKAIQMVEKASVILAIIGAAMKIATEIASTFKGESEEERAKAYIKQLNTIVDIYDKIIDKQKESIKFGHGFAAIEAATKAMDELNEQIDVYRNISVAGSTLFGSILRTQKEKDEYIKAMKELGIEVDEVNNLVSTNGLSNLSSKQLEYIRDNYKELWAALTDEQRNALQSIIDAEEEGKKIIDQWQEAITGISYDSFYSDFIDMLSDMDTSAEDMAENFGEYLRKSILAAMVAKEFQKDIDKLYQMWVNAGDEKSEGGIEITKDEALAIQEEQKKLTEAMIKRREEMEKVYGWESSGSSSQSSTQKGFEAMSQDTGDELNGRFTALQISGEEIKNQAILQTGLLSSINEKLSIADLTSTDVPMLMNSAIPNVADKSREIISNSYNPQINVIFPNEKFDALTLEVSGLKGIVDEMRTNQFEKFMDFSGDISRIAKNTPVINSKLDSIDNNIKKAL